MEYAADAVAQMKNAAVKQGESARCRPWPRLACSVHTAPARAARAGYLIKRAVKSRRNWKRRFFVLTESGLFMYLRRDTDRTPIGCVQLVPHAMVRAFPGRPNSFVVLTPYTPAGVACTASSENLCATWMHAIRSVIRRVEQQQQRLMQERQQRDGEEEEASGADAPSTGSDTGTELAGDLAV